MNNTFDLKRIGKIIGLLLIGLLIGWLIFGGSSPERPQTTEEHIEEAHTDEEGNIIYTCSMHPSVRENEPGNCPICGMELVPVSSDNNADETSPTELRLSPAAMMLADIQTTRVVRDVAINSRRLPGKIMVDERRLKTLPSHVPGRIENLYVNFTGEYIKKGVKVASIYSPELLSAQKELLEVAKFKDQNPSLYRAAQNKLRNWEISEAQIKEIEASQSVMNEVDITSKVEGYVIERMIDVGEHVSRGSTMYRIADLSKVWVVFDAYESDVAGITVGDSVSFSIKAVPGKEFSAEITFVDPVLNPQSRTISIRAEAENQDGFLKPNMLADGIITSKVNDGETQLLIPKSAILWTGERSVVYIKKQDREAPTFEFREVVLGQRVGDQYVVISGLQEGEEVVTNGTFKIDSAAQLAGKPSMMNQKPDGRPVRTGHEGHQMNGSEPMPPKTQEQTMNSDGHKGHSSSEQAPQAFQDQLATSVKDYITLKNSLVGSNGDEAKNTALTLQESLKDIDMSLLGNQDHIIWMEQLGSVSSAIKGITGTTNLDSQRTQFQSLSNAMVYLVKHFQIEGVYFQQFCPMADGGKGAYWLSEKEMINNPYFGEQMLSCGETIERIEH